MVASAASHEQAALEARDKERESRGHDDDRSQTSSSLTSRHGYSSDAGAEEDFLEKIGATVTLFFVGVLAFVLLAMIFAFMWLPPILFGFKNNDTYVWKMLGRLGMTSYDGATMTGVVVSVIGGFSLYALVRKLMDS